MIEELKELGRMEAEAEARLAMIHKMKAEAEARLEAARPSPRQEAPGKRQEAPRISPVGIYARGGAEALAEALEGLSAEALHEVIKASGLDTGRRTARWKGADRLRGFIMEAAERKATMGKVFLEHASEGGRWAAGSMQ